MKRRAALVNISFLVAAIGAALAVRSPRFMLLEFAHDGPAPTRGRLRVSVFEPGGGGGGGVRHHTSVYVNGPDYQGMEDNDLRGFPDGGFQYGWNQVSQVHLRIGRRGRSAYHGEYEIFRNIHRWDGIVLPKGARVVGASLEIAIETTPKRRERLVLYEMRKDWNPGKGGVHGNNNGKPNPGEVWWHDRAFPAEPWGLPGAGFHSDTHPEADAGEMLLADTRVEPGDAYLRFSSPELARAVSRRTAAKEPLLFLIKAADPDEDRAKGVVYVFSGNYGDGRTLARRPRLTLEWQSDVAGLTVARDVYLDAGRSCTLPRFAVKRGSILAPGFEAVEGYEPGHLEMRGGRGEVVDGWRRLVVPTAVDWEWVELRLRAARDPVHLGSEFDARIRDTWVRTRLPEKQTVLWTFTAPSGAVHEVKGKWQGENSHTWTVRFRPDELGRWRYTWRHRFTDHADPSTEGVFDVVCDDPEAAYAGMERLLKEIRGENRRRLEEYRFVFMRLERTWMRLQTPESYASDDFGARRALVDELRRALRGSVPRRDLK